MKIYHWHPDTKEFLGETDARVDPEEHRLAVERAIANSPTARKISVEIEHWLIPAHSTSETPPAPESEKHVVRRIRDKWVNELKPEFKPETKDETAERIVAEAQLAMTESQSIVLEYYEHKKPVPKSIVAYRDALRDIIKAKGEGVTALPKKPEA